MILPFPILKQPGIIDAFIAKMLIKNGCSIFAAFPFFKEPITVAHVIKYLQRDAEIYDWNSDFILRVQHEYDRAKESLIGENEDKDFSSSAFIYH